MPSITVRKLYQDNRQKLGLSWVAGSSGIDNLISTDEQRPTLDVTFKTKLDSWGIDDRNRFEWRMKDDGGDDYLRYRNRLRVKSPWKLTAFKINPYAHAEGFIEDKPGLSGGDMFNRYRLTGGVSAEFAKNIKNGLYVSVQSDRSSAGGWDRLGIFGFELGLGF